MTLVGFSRSLFGGSKVWECGFNVLAMCGIVSKPTPFQHVVSTSAIFGAAQMEIWKIPIANSKYSGYFIINYWTFVLLTLAL